jgi:hypothetical protein
VGAGVLSEVVTPRELLATLIALKRLLLSVKRAVVTLEVFLATESAVAKVAHKGLGGILSEGLLASPAVGGSGKRSGSSLGTAGIVRVAGGIGSLGGGLLGVARLGGGGSSNVHDGNSNSLVLVGLLDALVLMAVLRLASGRAGKSRELESLVLIKGQVLVTNEATVAERDDGRASAGTGATNISRLLSSEVDKAVHEVVLRLKVGEIFKSGQPVGNSRVEVKRLSGNDSLGLNLDLINQRELGGQGVDSSAREGQVPGIAKVDVVVRSGD